MPISGATRLLFVVGDPIAHASAPGLINTKLALADIDAVTVPLHVSNDGLAETIATNRDIVINATALGMNVDDPLPLDPASLEPHMLAAEVIIRPADTAFLQRAAQRGCSVHPGRPMLVAQLELMLEFMGVHTDGQ